MRLPAACLSGQAWPVGFRRTAAPCHTPLVMDNKKPRKVAPHLPAKEEAPQAPANQEQSSQEAKKGPLKTIRVDDVSASIWPREVMMKGEPTVFYSVTFERSYRDATGRYRYTRYFDVSDLGKVVAAAQQAEEFIRGLRQQEA